MLIRDQILSSIYLEIQSQKFWAGSQKSAHIIFWSETYRNLNISKIFYTGFIVLWIPHLLVTFIFYYMYFDAPFMIGNIRKHTENREKVSLHIKEKLGNKLNNARLAPNRIRTEIYTWSQTNVREAKYNWNKNNTARSRAKPPLMFRLPFEVYGAAITKTIKCNKMKWFFFLQFEIFYENHPPTRHMKYNRIDFAPCNKSIMANKLLLSNLEQFLRRINSPLTR